MTDETLAETGEGTGTPIEAEAAAADAKPARKAKPKADPLPALPESVTFTSTYGYLEGNLDDEAVQVLRYWLEGQTETNPERIAALVERGAPIKGA